MAPQTGATLTNFEPTSPSTSSAPSSLHHRPTPSRVASSSLDRPLLPRPPPLPLSLSPPPPPPPPPRLPVTAFASATTAARAHPPSRRQPTLHLIVVLAAAESSPAPLIQHAHCVLVLLSAKGIHVFLQTEFEHPRAHTLTPITHDSVTELVASSHADYVALVAQHNIQPPTVQLRLDPHASDFFDVPIHNLLNVILDNWTERIRTIPDSVQSLVLASNPNVLTSSHLHHFLQSISRFPPIRSTYAKLARLANLVQRWPSLSPPDPIPIRFSSPAPTSATLSAPGSFLTAPESAHIPCDVSRPVDRTTDNPVSTPNGYLSEPQILSLPPLPQNAVRKAARAAASAIAECSRPVLPFELSYNWLRRSHRISARLIRSQLLTRHIHRNLLSSFDTISSMPLASTLLSSYPSLLLPTHGHRRRLLREVNDLLLRIEQLAARLTKRPRPPRRRCRSVYPFIQANPWLSYIDSVRNSTGSIRSAEFASSINAHGSWRCTACHTSNRLTSVECSACHSLYRVVDTLQFHKDSTAWKARFDDAIKNAPPSSPWTFAPSFSSLTPFDSQPPHPIVPLERFQHELSPPVFHSPPVALRNRPLPSPRHDNGLHSRGMAPRFDLSGAFHSLSFDDEYTPTPIAHDYPSQLDTQRNKHSVLGSSAAILARHNGIIHDEGPTSLSPLQLEASLSSSNSILNLTSQHIQNGMRLDPGTPLGTPSQHMDAVKSHPSARPTGNGFSEFQNRRDGASYTASLSLSQPFPDGLLFGEGFVPVGSLYENSVTNEVGGVRETGLLPGLASSQPSVPTIGLAIEELTAGSYEATEDIHRFHITGRKPPTPKAMGWRTDDIPRGGGLVEGDAQADITSLEALAAASDAANGGTGSATKESLRTVSALVTPGRNSLNSPRSNETNDGTYNMF